MSDTVDHVITLYDVDGKKRPYSPYVMKTRLLLNYKRLPHKTIWILHENVQANNRALGLGPTNAHAPQWTVPVIRDTHSGAEPVAIVDSDKIADYLEAVYPTRPIATAALRSAQQAHIDAINRCFAANVRRIVVPSLVDNLEGSNRAYFKNSRAEIFGMEIEEMYPEDKREELWAVLRAGMDELAAHIGSVEHGDHSLFSTGPEVVYADLYLASFFPGLKAGPPGAFETLMSWNDGLWAREYGLCEKYMAVL